jgi:hypothetical protein
MNNLPVNCDVLFCSYGGGHVAALEPVARKLTDLDFKVGYFALTTAQRYLERASIPYFGFKEVADHFNFRADPRYAKLVESNSSNLVNVEETFAYITMNFDELVMKNGFEVAMAEYQLGGRQSFFPVENMRRILSFIKPKVVVSTNSPRSERAIFTAAKELGIARVCVVDLFALQEIEWLKEVNFADSICVLNSAVKQSFLNHGCKAEQVKVTGNPAFDKINAGETLELARSWRTSKNISNKKKVILWASQIEPEKHPFSGRRGDPRLPLMVENQIRHLVANRDDLHLIIRPHPNENRIVAEGDNVSVSDSNEPLHPILHAVNVVVVLTSTVGLEAAISGTPVITVDNSVFTQDAPYSKYGISRGINNLNELESAIDQAIRMQDVNRKHQIAQSTNNVCDEIIALLEKNR